MDRLMHADAGADIYANDPWVHSGHPTDPMSRRFKGTTMANGASFDVLFMQEVGSNLYVGGCVNGLVLPPFIRHVVSLYTAERYKLEHELSTHLLVNMRDALDQSMKSVEALSHWVNECREDGPVLVHCQAGLNRSPLICARAMYHYDEKFCFDETSGIPYDESNPVGAAILSHLRTVRSPAVLCNKTFEAEVLSWTL